MKVHHKEFDEMHRQMKAWIKRRRGSLSLEVERAAERVVLSLWSCAHNKNVPQVLLQGLAEDTEALARARQQ